MTMIDTEKYIRQLKPEAKRRLAEKIDQLILEEIHENAGWSMGEYYMETMSEILGQKIDDSRSLDFVFARAVISYCLYGLGWPEEKIGKLLGRNHSTVNYYRRMMRDMLDLPSSNPQLHWLYKEFKQRIEDDGQ